MFNLDPGKLLVIAVVAIILLGPDRLPQVARQVGGAWKSFNEFRRRVESEVRDTVPDLPPTSEIARLVRSPSALLNHLSTMSEKEEAAAAEAAAAWEPGADLADEPEGSDHPEATVDHGPADGPATAEAAEADEVAARWEPGAVLADQVGSTGTTEPAAGEDDASAAIRTPPPAVPIRPVIPADPTLN